MARKLTKEEEKAIIKLKKALESMPKTLSIFFEGHGVCVYDTSFLEDADIENPERGESHHLQTIYPSCDFDAGGW